MSSQKVCRNVSMCRSVPVGSHAFIENLKKSAAAGCQAVRSLARTAPLGVHVPVALHCNTVRSLEARKISRTDPKHTRVGSPPPATLREYAFRPPINSAIRSSREQASILIQKIPVVSRQNPGNTRRLKPGAFLAEAPVRGPTRAGARQSVRSRNMMIRTASCHPFSIYLSFDPLFFLPSRAAPVTD